MEVFDVEKPGVLDCEALAGPPDRDTPGKAGLLHSPELKLGELLHVMQQDSPRLFRSLMREGTDRTSPQYLRRCFWDYCQWQGKVCHEEPPNVRR